MSGLMLAMLPAGPRIGRATAPCARVWVVGRTFTDMDDDLRRAGSAVYDRWTALWNRDPDEGVDLLAPALTLRYAQGGSEAFDDVRTPEDLVALIDAWHVRRGGRLRFAAEGVPVVDVRRDDGGPTGLVARPYLVTHVADDGTTTARSGTDVLRVERGRIAEVWSVSSGAGGRTFYRE
jgi:hypothetical protein